MVNVGRTGAGGKHTNVVVLKRVRVVFQRYSGTAGTNADRAIAGVAYSFIVEGRTVSTGNTAADGSVTLDVRVGSRCVLRIFDTDYVIQLPALEAENTIRGHQRRLQLLGYELGNVDGVAGRKSGEALLRFQADNNPLDTDGLIGRHTRTQLRTQFGE